VQHSPDLAPGRLVGVAQYHAGKRGYPLAVGRMKDKLWELGRKAIRRVL
jgi:hypothetical protein